ncbi:MAG: HIT domain-containing protein [Alphaproteobacteria bacterium]|nr:HIT domain-containing protein [Alphaproteobacteria bacterium]
MTTPYDADNIFAQILDGRIPSSPVDETPDTLSFADINPQAPVHHLVIPKGPYADLTSFAENASDKELAEWVRGLARAATSAGIAQSGYRVVVNCGADSHQEVPHLHGHVLGGHPLGPILTRRD